MAGLGILWLALHCPKHYEVEGCGVEDCLLPLVLTRKVLTASCDPMGTWLVWTWVRLGIVNALTVTALWRELVPLLDFLEAGLRPVSSNTVPTPREG